MTALNLGDFALAVSSLETYLQLDPNGPKAAEVKGIPAGAAEDGQEVDRSDRSIRSSRSMSVAVRLAEVRARIDAAARGAGRDPSSVRLVAVSKTFPIDAVREAYAAGQRDFGENRVQEALEKIDASHDLPDARWHLLGHLQTNKARKAAPAFAMIQSVDSVDLLQKLDAAAAESGHAPELLVQVDLAGEDTKYGTPPTEVPRNPRGRRTVPRRTGRGAHDPATNPGYAGGRAAVVPAAAGSARRMAGGRRPGRNAAGTVDGHERRFRSGRPGRRDDCPRGNGNLWLATRTDACSVT